jgi:hypothetical protein
VGQAQYDVYITNVLSLAKSMVIKSELQAQAINNYLSTQYTATGDSVYEVNDADPTTWKYYLNLSGQYHPSDTMMTVISQDSLQTIDFTVANLQINTATAAAYAVGGRYYNDLVAAYPTQSQLIRGILNPVDITTAIAADDGSVLWMDPTLVESNEMNLQLEITRWAQYWFRRWNVPAYANVDDLYVAAMLGVMYANLPHTILRIRQKNAPTYMAHSFHLGEYLETNGGLNQYQSSMTKAQMLWLRRNLRYILRNPGKQSTFDSLVENILTARGIPLSSWTMRHDTTNTQSTLVNNPVFVRNNVNDIISEAGIDEMTVAGMLQLEQPMARDNADDTDTITDVTNTLAWSLDDNLATKVLQSSMLDTTDATPYKLSDCLLNHWLYFGSLGIYTAITTVQDPVTGDYYNFTPTDAFIVYMYCFQVGQGLPPLETIPMLWANKVRKIPTPPPSEIQQFLTDAVDSEDLAAVYLNQPSIANTYVSIDAFNAAVNAIHDGELFQHALFSTQGHLWTRAEMEFATLYLWTDYQCDLGAGQNYAEWFSSRNLDIPSLSVEQMNTLANNIVMTATGANNSTVETLADLQAAMLGIMQQLSSYTVQYIATINTSPLIVLERPSIRLGDVTADADESVDVTIPQGQLMDAAASGEETFKRTTISDVSRYQHHVSGEATFDMHLNVRLEGKVKNTVVTLVPMLNVGIQGVTDNLDWTVPTGLDTNLNQYQPISYQSLPEIFTSLALPFYTPLNTQDQQVMLDRYYAYIDQNGTPAGLLSWFISVTQLPPLSPLYPLNQ